jgi:hypothetical protein
VIVAIHPQQECSEQAVAALEASWPGWQIWVVHRVYGGLVWCVRRFDVPGDVLNAGSPRELARMLAQAVS